MTGIQGSPFNRYEVESHVKTSPEGEVLGPMGGITTGVGWLLGKSMLYAAALANPLSHPGRGVHPPAVTPIQQVLAG
jgi:hypothetical protein